MVSRETLRVYDFKSMEDYFYYLDQSIVNGQRTQAKILANGMSKKQKLNAIHYFEELGCSDAKRIVLESI